MTDYIDTYIACADKTTLEAFAAMFTTKTPMLQGRVAQVATEESPAVEQVGDPSLWYVGIRATVDLSPVVKAPLSVVPAETGAAVVGVFA